ncbi:hypothetical protein F0562_030434 [Nyssa sinensis]|uniref:50S ribosomal protein L35 n=1 Tax=Nyssa sinensis TaxID=561372 RepID=A0A5J5AWD3_9ASTE|nr:hypothetical protein F0562_030434 [Nyssa sinensis]
MTTMASATMFSFGFGVSPSKPSASAKRFRVTGTGKIMRRRAGKQHLLRKKNAKRRSRLSKMQQVDRGDYDNVIGALPYLKGASSWRENKDTARAVDFHTSFKETCCQTYPNLCPVCGLDGKLLA